MCPVPLALLTWHFKMPVSKAEPTDLIVKLAVVLTRSAATVAMIIAVHVVILSYSCV